MGRKLEISLDAKQREELETGYRTGKSHAFRQRCRMVLLKSEGQFSKDIAKIVGIESQSQINDWIRRYKTDYESQGIEVLHNKPGQGRKHKLDKDLDEAVVRRRVTENRQRLSKAKELLEGDLGRKFSLKTLKRFLKNLSPDQTHTIEPQGESRRRSVRGAQGNARFAGNMSHPEF
jgi:transposase